MNYFGVRVELVLTACGAAWPVHHFIAAVGPDDPVLERRHDRSLAACSGCHHGRRTQWTAWNRMLAEQGSLLDVADVQRERT
ncbi:MAG TPA: hypothetical protein VD763_05880 [Candidatus Saccharimonadales bacterium]|nr:hypothetical protein [Candidatus Saccharimonadales bacterium]